MSVYVPMLELTQLYAISSFLNQPIQNFFEGLEEQVLEGGLFELQREVDTGSFLSSEEGIELAKSFPKIARPGTRRKILELVTTLANEG